MTCFPVLFLFSFRTPSLRGISSTSLSSSSEDRKAARSRRAPSSSFTMSSTSTSSSFARPMYSSPSPSPSPSCTSLSFPCVEPFRPFPRLRGERPGRSKLPDLYNCSTFASRPWTRDLSASRSVSGLAGGLGAGVVVVGVSLLSLRGLRRGGGLLVVGVS